MNITQKKSEDRKSQVSALFFIHKIPQKKIAEGLWLSIRTIKRYVKKVR